MIRYFSLFPLLLFIIISAASARETDTIYAELKIYNDLLNNEKKDSSYSKALNKQIKPLKGFDLELSNIRSLNTETSIKTGMFLDLAERAASKNDVVTELDALLEAFTLAFWEEPRDFNRAFILDAMLQNRLTQTDKKDYPAKNSIYVKLGEAYYIFNDFNKSIELLKNVSGPPVDFADNSKMEALRISGICYANMGRMDLSDSCFTSMLTSSDMILNRSKYNALAISNLACNSMLKGQYDKAISLNGAVLPLLKTYDDPGHIAGMYACLGYSFFGKKEYEKVRIFSDSVLYYAHKDGYNPIKRTKQGYALKAKYYTAVNNAIEAQSYNDSLVSLYKLQESEYNLNYIFQAHNDLKDSELRKRNEEIKVRSTIIIIISFFSFLCTAALFFIICLYRRKRMAYRALAEKNRLWAEQKGDRSENNKYDVGEEQSMRNIIRQIEDILIKEKKYSDSEISLESLSEITNINKNNISKAVNNLRGKNFTGYINEFRVKEAIKILSANSKITVDDVAFLCGFGNRVSLYNAFKKETGLSPTEFRKNINLDGKKL